MPVKQGLCAWVGEQGRVIFHVAKTPTPFGVTLVLNQAPRGSHIAVGPMPKPTQYMSRDEVVAAQLKKQFDKTYVSMRKQRIVVSRPWHFGIWITEEYRFQRHDDTESGVSTEVLGPSFTLGMPHVL